MSFYDFRSDTVTQPTKEMRIAMAEAIVGDDVYGDDPTVNELEQKSANMLGKEAGLFVASGTMGNLIAVLAHCSRGDEAIMGTYGHTFLHEAGGISVLGGVVIHTVPNQVDGTIALSDLENALRDPNDFHEPVSRLVIIENTQNACGGVPISVAYTNQVAQFCREHNLLLHIDGARIFNAAVALNVPAADLVSQGQSITFCLSKGLAAPVGSVLCGDAVFIDKARRIRKILGGGMRQAGIIAAAGLISLEKMVDRLADDHLRAQRLGDGLKKIEGVKLTRWSPHTNMIFVALDQKLQLSNEMFIDQMKRHNILLNPVGKTEYRLVTHNDINDEAVNACIQAFEEIVKSKG